MGFFDKLMDYPLVESLSCDAEQLEMRRVYENLRRKGLEAMQEKLQVRTWCAHCKKYKDEHMEDGKCLYLPTSWKTEWLGDLPPAKP